MEAGLDFLLWRGGHAAEGTSVEGIVGTDNLVAAPFFAVAEASSVQASELDQRFVGFGTAIAEEDFSGVGALDESVCEFCLAGDSVEIAAMDELCCLILYCLYPFRVGVSERGDGYTGAEIKITLPSVVVEVDAFTAHCIEGGRTVIPEETGGCFHE